MNIIKNVKKFISFLGFSSGKKEKLSSKELINPKRAILIKNNNNHNIIYTKKNFSYTNDIYYIPNEENKTNDSFSSSTNEPKNINCNKKITLRQKYDKRIN